MRRDDQRQAVKNIPLEQLKPFKNHPFQVRDDEEFRRLVESIEIHGVIHPAVARQIGEDCYELISGHRRKAACEVLGYSEMPVLVQSMTDDEAVVNMVDANLQRETILPSERAFAYKMKVEAMKRKAGRPPKNLSQVATNIDTATEIGQQLGESRDQVYRYIRLTYLIPELLKMVDEQRIAFTPAVEISYLRNEEQQVLLQYMSNHNMVPSMKQAKELKQISKERMLTYSEIDQICMNESTEKVQVQIPAKKLKQYFPETYTKTQMEEIIFMLLASWAEREGEE